ncbi:MAG: flagellar basal-body rod protein FlgC [Gaiellales bacterium]|jgi:flagellar basal-body rod protein FlgC|nr:flagellar basal-body rod protein FlgC [Gaiellales bacterium]MDX6596729.1 flagellar basal-body rod protein FlgC [Gaiellales bacterium]
MSGIFGALGISASGMAAERLRLDVTSANLANADTTRGANGKPYVRQEVALQAGGVSSFSNVLTGVQVAGIVNDPSPARRVYDPSHPDADANGYVSLPNVNSVTEMTDLIAESRSYEANTQAFQTAKTLYAKTIDLLR